MPTGRYRGVSLASIPKDYLRWLLRQPNVRPALRIGIKHELGIMADPLPAHESAFDFKMAAAGEGRE